MSLIGKEVGIQHGTIRGVRQHKRRRVPACEACLAAKREDNPEPSQAQVTAQRSFKASAQAAWNGGRFAHRPGPSVSRTLRREEPAYPEGTIPGRDLRIGDVIDYLRTGRGHRVDQFEPYAGPLKGVLGTGVRVARSADGWGMTIGPDAAIRILQRTGGGGA